MLSKVVLIRSRCFATVIRNGRGLMADDMQGKRMSKYGVLENEKLTADDWKSRWNKSQIGFHSSDVNKDLKKYENLFLSEKCKVFLPLCGKSVDLLYLADKGHDVYGCEFVEKAVQDFFSENSLEYIVKEKSTSSGSIKEYKAVSKQVTLFQGDFFTLTTNVIEKFDAIWDKASLIAIDPSQRREYPKIMKDLLTPNGKYLLDTLYIANENYYGPPHSVSSDDINELYKEAFNIQLLSETEDTIKLHNVTDSKYRSIHLLTLK